MNLQKLKKLNLKQPKYALPLVILLPLLGLIYFTVETFSGKGDTAKNGVATDSINMALPAARTEEFDGKMAAMTRNFSEGDAYTAVDGLGDEVEQKDTTGSGYNEKELSEIDKVNAARLRQLKVQQELQRCHEENMRSLNSGGSGRGSYDNGYGGGYGSRSQQNELNDYARELENIQNRSLERQRKYQEEQDRKDREAEAEERRQRQEMIDALTGNTKKKQKPEEKAEVVEKVKNENSEKFNTVSNDENVDEPLIKAMIDKTTKAREGSRLRFKLLDDVKVKGLKLKKGSYLYGIVTGLGQQRVKANITSILVGSKFIKVNLAVYDNDGMEGFYVPESAFREMVKDASANVASQQLQFDTSSGTGISGEMIAHTPSYDGNVANTIYVNEEVTTHIIMPENIKLVDISTATIVGNQCADNIVRLKPSGRMIDKEIAGTITIIGERHIAQFKVVYAKGPAKANSIYNITQDDMRQYTNPDVSMTQGDMARLAWSIFTSSRNKYGIRSTLYGIKARVNNIYTVGDYFFIDFSLKNYSKIKYDIAEIRLKLMDKKKMKATNSQTIELTPVYMINHEKSFQKEYRNVIVLKKLTFPNEKKLRLEISEDQISGRVSYIDINYRDILNADSFSEKLLINLQ